MMTPAQRTIGPPAAPIAALAPPSSSLLSRLQRSSDPASASASASQNLLPELQASSSSEPGQPIFMQQEQTGLRPGAMEQSSRHFPPFTQSGGQPQAVVVTPVNPQGKAKQRGQGHTVPIGVPSSPCLIITLPVSQS